MGMNAQAGADALGAVREAIQMYMGLRQQRIDNQSRDTANSRAAKQLELQEQAAELDANQFRETQVKNERDMLLDVIDRFGGQETQQGARFRTAGLGDAVEAVPGLSARTLPTSVQPTGGPDTNVQTLERYSTGPDTGRERIRTPESEKARIAYWTAAQRASEGALNRGTRVEVANIGADSRERVAAANRAVDNASLALRRYGIDVASMDRQRILARLTGNDTANMDAKQYQLFLNSLEADPLSFLRFMQNDTQVPPPPSLRPSNPGIGAGGGAGEWEITPSR